MKEKNLAILIDCWSTPFQLLPFDPDRRLYKRIIDFIDTDTSIDAVCLSSYNISKEEYFSNNHWYANLEERTKSFERLENHNQNLGISTQKTSNVILHWKSKKKQFVAHFADQIDSSYDKIYLCGKALEICVLRRPLGLYGLLKDNKSNIFIKKQCVLTENGRIPKSIDPNIWLRVSEDTYTAKNIKKENFIFFDKKG
jgi:hypothetical protein